MTKDFSVLIFFIVAYAPLIVLGIVVYYQLTRS